VITIDYITFDIEAHDWNQFLIGCIYDGENSFYYYSAEELAKGCIYHGKGKKIYAHNGGKYDFRFILPYLLKNYKCSFLPIGASLVKISVYYNSKSKKKICEFRDSYNILESSLKKLAESFRVTQKLSVDRTDLRSLSPEELKKYVQVDCIALYEVIEKALEKFGVEEFAITSASESFREWRKLENEKQYQVNASLDVDLRKSYKGARTEVFCRKGYNLTCYDVVSMYPYVMKNHYFPAGNVIYTATWKFDLLGIYKCKVKTPEYMEYPFLPYRDKNGKLLFPLGEWTDWYCSPEIQKASELGYQIEIIEGFVWSEQRKPFENYINKWIKIKSQAKKDNDEALKYVAKLRLNGLYGKFGQRRELRKVTQDINMQMVKNENVFPLFEDLELYSYPVEDKKPFTYVHIASFVTCYARIRLYEIIEDVVSKGGYVYYCDTDSVTCDVQLEESSELGGLEIEKSGEEFIFLFPKVYAYKSNGKTHKKAKGFYCDSLKFSNYKKALKGRHSQIKSEKRQLAGFFEASRRQLRPLDVIIKKRSLQGTFDKRKLLNDGITTKPRTL